MVKFLSKRGNVFQFSRRVPNDIRRVVGIDHWRWSLKTDSKAEAEIACRKHAVETDRIIEQVRNGTFRQFTDTEIDDLAIAWGIQFQSINRERIAASMFPDVIPLDEAIGDEEPTPVFASRRELERSVARWATKMDNAPAPDTADWSKLVDACLDGYLVANPELTNDWKDVLAELDHDISNTRNQFIEVVKRPKKVATRNLLSSVFKDFMASDHDLASNTITEYKLSIDRFISVHGDIDVNEITKEHVKQFRDLLRKVPSRPPNDVRALPISQQAAWAEDRTIDILSQAAINKNFLGVKAALNHAYNETNILMDPHWRNPFDGFSKKPKRSQNPVKRFTDEQVQLVFSHGLYQPATLEKFWIPLVLFFTGARLTEISQLHVNDVQVAPIPHIVVENLEDEDPAAAKKLKNESSHRTVPLHSKLLEIGFLDHVAAMRSAGHLHVFPNLPHDKVDGVGDLVSRDFINRFRSYGEIHPASGLNTKSLVTHSLRHTFRTNALKLEQQLFVQIIMGHYVPGVSIEVYGSDAYMMPDLLAEKVMNPIQFPELDISFLKTQARKWLESN